MSYYLRVESVNLSYFIDDTNDLSTTRGGGLLLLEAMEMVEGVIEELSPKKVKISEDEIAQLQKEVNILKNSKKAKTRANKKIIEQKEDEITAAKKGPIVPPSPKVLHGGYLT